MGVRDKDGGRLMTGGRQPETQAAAGGAVGRQRAARPYDAAAKQLLVHKPLLAYIMKNTLGEYADLDVETIAREFIEGDIRAGSDPVDARCLSGPLVFGPRNEDDSLDDGTVRYDVLFRARRPVGDGTLGLIVNIEPQAHMPDYSIAKRAAYYCARLLSAQRGAWPSGDEYDRLEKVCSIWICMNPRLGEADSVTEYVMRERVLRGSVRRDPLEYDLQSIVIACLPQAGGYNGFTETLATLFSFETTGHDKMRALETQLGPELAREFRGVTGNMTTLGEYAVDYGIAKGIKQGEERATMSSLRNLMQNLSWEPERAMEAIGLPEQDRPRYRELLGMQGVW